MTSISEIPKEYFEAFLRTASIHSLLELHFLETLRKFSRFVFLKLNSNLYYDESNGNNDLLVASQDEDGRDYNEEVNVNEIIAHFNNYTTHAVHAVLETSEDTRTFNREFISGFYEYLYYKWDEILLMIESLNPSSAKEFIDFLGFYYMNPERYELDEEENLITENNEYEIQEQNIPEEFEYPKTFLMSQIHVDQFSNCAICLVEFFENDKGCELSCRHTYHDDCIKEWLGINSSCPLCRQPVTNGTTEPHMWRA